MRLGSVMNGPEKAPASTREDGAISIELSTTRMLKIFPRGWHADMLKHHELMFLEIAVGLCGSGWRGYHNQCWFPSGTANG